MVNQQTIEELIATCNLLGYTDEDGTYFKDPDCESCLRDLIRFMRKDDNSFTILRQLGQIHILATDLIPLMKQHCSNDEHLFDLVLRLMVMLTNPALILFEEKIPTTIEEKQIYLQINSFIIQYKCYFSRDVKLWSILAKRIGIILEKDWDNRLEEHRIMLERILILIRNIVNAPIDISYNSNQSNEDNEQDYIIQTMKKSGILDLIIYMCQTPTEYQLCFHHLEIMMSLLRDQNAEFLAKSNTNLIENHYNRRSAYEIKMDDEELKDIRDSEKKCKKPFELNSYSRFKESTYVVKNFKSIGENDIILHKAPVDFHKISFDENKQKIRKPKNRRPFEDVRNVSSRKGESFHRSSLNTRVILKNFCSNFIYSCYNQMIYYVKSALERKIAQENDETYYLWASQFFMEFNRCSNADSNFIIETFSVESFHYLHTLIEHHLDMFLQEKKDFILWSKRLHYALKSYRELLFTISYVLYHNKNENLKIQAEKIIDMIFYEPEYRELLLALISGFNEVKMPFSYLKDLIETNHLFLKMLDKFNQRHEKMMVKTKKRKVPKCRKKHKADLALAEAIWTEISSELSIAVLNKVDLPQPDENQEVIPLDILSEKSKEEQKVDVFKRIHKLLIKKRPFEAVALYRNAREAFSEDEDQAFGIPNISPEDELAALHEIIVSDLWQDHFIQEKEDELLEPKHKSNEKQFDMIAFISKYANQKLIRAYTIVLKKFETNNHFLNHAIVKLFHRIAWDCKMPAFFFQLSLFRVFQRSLDLPTETATESAMEIRDFARFIISNFVDLAKTNDNLLMELLFWKTSKQVYEITEGYGSYSSRSSTRKKQRSNEKNESEVEVKQNEIQHEDYDLDENENEQNQNSTHTVSKTLLQDNEIDEDVINFENLKKHLDLEYMEIPLRKNILWRDSSNSENEDNSEHALLSQSKDLIIHKNIHNNKDELVFQNKQVDQTDDETNLLESKYSQDKDNNDKEEDYHEDSEFKLSKRKVQTILDDSDDEELITRKRKNLIINDEDE